jgi:glycosyltransferase involved in cell wall biosynthesis
MDAYIGISRHVCDLILAKGMPADRVHLIPVGIGPPPAIGTADPVLLARLDVAFPVLGMVGRLVERKGVPWFLAEVAGQWLPRHPKARLVIAGDGPMRQRIEALVAQLGLGDQVIVSGEIPEAMKWWLMARSDLMLMPNVPVAGDAEGFGLVALESASVGTWVAVSDLEGLRDAVSEGGNGSRIEAKNARAWNSALERLCGDRDALQEMGERAREFVAENCSWAAIGARYSSLFQALASHAT